MAGKTGGGKGTGTGTGTDTGKGHKLDPQRANKFVWREGDITIVHPPKKDGTKGTKKPK